MKERPYHHLPDGTFRNPKGSPVIISRSGKFSYRTFSKLRKKVDLSYPKEHVIEKEKVLADLEKYKDKIRKILNWKPLYSLDSLIDDMIDFQKKHSDLSF